MKTEVGTAYDKAKDAISEFRAAVLAASGGVEVAIDPKNPLYLSWEHSREVADWWDVMAASVTEYEDAVEMGHLEYKAIHKRVCIECGVNHDPSEVCQDCTECGYRHHSNTSCSEYAVELAEYREDR